MKVFKHMLAAAIIVSGISACATAPTSDIEVHAETAKNANFSAYKTYAWLAAAQVLFDPEGQWEPRNVDIDAEVQALIDKQLQKRGMVEVSGTPDLVIAYAAGVDMTILELKQDPETDEEMLSNVPKAALVVALIENDTGYVQWIGTALGDVRQELTADQTRTRIAYAIENMFKLLPAK